MTHTYRLDGMTCSNCEADVRNKLLLVPDITDVTASRTTATAEITMARHVALGTLQDALGGPSSKYRIAAATHHEAAEQAKGWLATYKPILLIFAYVTLVAGIAAGYAHGAPLERFMTVFMSGFFLTFSFFKMLDLRGFAESYAMYDVVARRFPAWGYLYAFTELALGIAYALEAAPLVVNTVTLVVMTVSIVGVLQSVLNKRTIRCACLGAVFNLPMSTVTIVEDGLMIAMSVAMLAMAA